MMTACRSRIELKTSNLRRSSSVLRRDPSTPLSHEHEANVNRKEASTAVKTLRCLPMFAFRQAPVQPATPWSETDMINSFYLQRNSALSTSRSRIEPLSQEQRCWHE